MIDIDALIEDYEKKARWNQHLAENSMDMNVLDHREKAERFEFIAKALAFFKEEGKAGS